jgi:hypothetical protein
LKGTLKVPLKGALTVNFSNPVVQNNEFDSGVIRGGLSLGVVPLDENKSDCGRVGQHENCQQEHKHLVIFQQGSHRAESNHHRQHCCWPRPFHFKHNILETRKRRLSTIFKRLFCKRKRHQRSLGRNRTRSEQLF